MGGELSDGVGRWVGSRDGREVDDLLRVTHVFYMFSFHCDGEM